MRSTAIKVGRVFLGSVVTFGVLSMAASHTHCPKSTLASFGSCSASSAVRGGGASLQGFRDHMEDEVLLHYTENYSFFGVFDGHGGARASLTARAHMPHIFDSHPLRLDDPPTALTQTFHKTEEKYKKLFPRNDGFEGSTAVVAVIYPGVDKVVIANTGDSRGIICAQGKVKFETVDHKPASLSERARIVRLGGRVLQGPFGDCPRIYKGVQGGLAVSRAIGDTFYGDLVPVDPDVSQYLLSPQDEFVVLASDGVWDVMTSADVCRFVTLSMENGYGVQKSSDSLIRKAIELGSYDNVSAVIVDVRKHPDKKEEKIASKL